MYKRLVAAAVTLGALGAAAALAVPTAGATANGSICRLSGTATFGTPLTANTKTDTYTFTGTLSNCGQGTASGSFSQLTGSISTDSPVTLNGGCTQSTSDGYSTTSWSNGATTVIHYQTSGAAAAVKLDGTVVASDPNVKDVNGNPVYTTSANSPIPVGQSAIGQLTFTPSDPQDCNGSGVPSAPINGLIESGSQS